MRTPHADHRELDGDLADRHRGIVRLTLHPQPAHVAVDIAGAGDDAEALLAAPRTAGLEMLGPLPSVLGAEDRAEILHARVQRAGALRPAPFVGVEWIPEQVVVAVRLASQLGRVARVAMHRTESPRPVRVQV